MVAAKMPIETVALAKLTYGARPADIASFKKLGLAAWLNDQLNPKKAENSFITKSLATLGSLNLSGYEVKETFPYSIKNHLVADEVTFATLLRRYWSDRQVFEMLVEFLHDYNPSPRGVEDSAVAHYDKSVIRANALGYYPDLVLASSRSPGMLAFLNGNDNTKKHPNENYGRELLELFTVSTAHAYTQDDVITASRVLTGITGWLYKPEIQVWPNWHWNGPVSLLGWSDPNPGGSETAILQTAESMIRYLALHEATATAFSLRMARRFVSDTPPPALVKAMAATYTKTKGHIPSVFKTMALSKEFAASYRAKVKRPSEFVASTIRALDLKMLQTIEPGNPRDTDFFRGNPVRQLHKWSLTQGHAPFQWPFPDGYPDTQAPWTTMSAQVIRWNLGQQLAFGWGRGPLTTPNYKKLLPSSAKTPEQILDAASLKFLGAKLPSDERAAALGIMKKVEGYEAAEGWQRKAEIATSLLIAKPEWNLR
jgi:hypothetical protein